MTEFTTDRLGIILGALAGKPRRVTTKAGALRAIARQAAAIGRTKEAVLAMAPGLLEGWLDPAAWRQQLTAPPEPAVTDQRGEPGDRAVCPPAEAAQVAFRPGTKQALIAGLLEREQGATLDELIAATGWLPHTTRAALTGLRRKGFALDKSSRENGKTAWHIEPPDKAAPDDAGSGGQG
jgi:Protein of unknown function (DUF3489)